MIEKQSLSPQRMIDCLNADYGIAVTTLTPLPLGADMSASVYKARAFDGPLYFVKLKWGHHSNIGLTILSLLQASGIQEVIPPIKTLHGEASLHIDGFTLIVYPFIEGESGFSRHLTDDHWVTLGKVLRQVHEFDVPPSIKHQIKKETYSARWREAVRALYIHPQMGDHPALQLQAFMKEHRATVLRLVDRAEALSQKILSQAPKFVLCHSDIHGGNVLIDRNGAIYIVDWDEPIMAPKERDLMFIGGGIANIWNHPREEQLFYKGYGKAEVDRTILAYYRHERIVEDIALYGQALLLTAGKGADRQQMYKRFVAMFEPRGVVDIAFKTDEG